MIKDFLRDWIIPPKWYQLIRGMRNSSLKGNSVQENNTNLFDKFKDSHKGKRIFILASGPSINTQNLKPLGKEICISVSQFCLHQDVNVIRPKYHLLAPLHRPFGFETSEKIFTSLKRYTWDYTCFIGINNFVYSHDKYLESHPDMKPSNIYYLNYQNSPQINEQNRDNPTLWNPALTPFAMRTVVFGAIMMAAWMGANEIILLGCDHDYLKDTSRVENHHFYKESEGFSDKEHLSAFTSEKWFEEYYYRWKQYRLMGEHLVMSNQRIINATAGGMLDVFPRMELEEVLINA